LKATHLSSIEFARYQAPLLTPADVVWGISNSGSAARTREAVVLARAKGNLTVGVTGSRTGPLAALADTYVYRPVGELLEIDAAIRGVFLNMAEYLTTLYALYFTGLHIGIDNRAIEKAHAEEILSECEAAILSIGELAAEYEPAAAEMAAQLKGLDTIWIIGAGPSQGTARYCAAKFHEQLPWNGIPEDLEEWAHLQYFLTLTWKERSVVFVLAPPGNSLERAEELVKGIADAGGRAIAVSHPEHGEFPDAWRSFLAQGHASEYLSPITYHLPAQLLVLHIARQLGHEPFALRRQDDYKLIRQGVVLNDLRSLS
jgi:glucosamine--fructose-6-phosphate aminotransferase (isomerizing)